MRILEGRNMDAVIAIRLKILIIRAEGIAIVDVSACQSFLQPAHSLCRCTMVEGIGHGISLNFLLQIVVTYSLKSLCHFINDFHQLLA